MHNALHNLILAAAIFFTTNAFAKEDYRNQEFCEPVLLELFASGDSALLDFDFIEGKAYLNPDSVIPTREGLFLKTEQGHIEVPILHSNHQGCYMTCSQIDATVYPIIRCKVCGSTFSPTIFNRGKCPRCGAQN